jgi:FtsP/CotA-like multicopper oxidase with cupredoxin domain
MHNSSTTRRNFLSSLARGAGLLLAPAGISEAADVIPDSPADVELRIAPVQLEIAQGQFIHTVGYNGSAPGPVIRFREGVAANVDIFNDTASRELVHWHGFEVPVDVDGAEEEGSLGVPAHGRLRYRLTPLPSGSRYVHTHAMAMTDLNRGAFSGQFAFAWIEPKNNPGQYDQEIFLATHEWQPYLTTMEEEEHPTPSPRRPRGKSADKAKCGWEVAYRRFTINGKCLGFGEPIRVKEGQQVLFHFLNASATESVRLALPGHRFRVIALDGNPAPHPSLVDVIELGTAERVDAIVTMDSPGKFILGTPSDDQRDKGMGIVVEYANRTGKPRWIKPPRAPWDYRIFGENRQVPKPDRLIPLVIGQGAVDRDGFETWTINGKPYDPSHRTPLAKGERHRLLLDNQTDDIHPVHLHRGSFELTKVFGTPTAGIVKDVVLVNGHDQVEVDVTPLLDGLSLFHCHQQLHMDHGFKMLFDVT